MTTRVLICDDHGDLRKLVRLTLDMGAYEMHETDCADRALEAMPVIRPDIVILDVMMPGSLDGIALCRLLKQEGRQQPVKVVMLSAKGQQSDIAHGIESGADAYLVKPFSPLQLIDTVKKVLADAADGVAAARMAMV